MGIWQDFLEAFGFSEPEPIKREKLVGEVEKHWTDVVDPTEIDQEIIQILRAFEYGDWTGDAGVFAWGERLYHEPGLGYWMSGIEGQFGFSRTTTRRKFIGRWRMWERNAPSINKTPDVYPADFQYIAKIIDLHPLWGSIRKKFWFRSNRPGDPVAPAQIRGRLYRYRLTEKRKREYRPRKRKHVEEFPIKSPFYLPKLIDREWEEKRKDFIAKHGYQVVAPGWRDVIKIPVAPDLTKEDYKEFAIAKRQRRVVNLPPHKVAYLEHRADVKRRMLGNPQPKWYRSVSSILTAIDDAEDALSTACVLGRIAIRLAPKLLGRMVPVLGWALLANDILEFANLIGRMPFTARRSKRTWNDFKNDNPFSKRGRMKNARRFLRRRPGIGALLEALQTTETMFGTGVSLGPLMAYPADLFFGVARQRAGQPVSWEGAVPTLASHEIKAYQLVKSAPAAIAVNPWIPDDERMRIIVGWFLSMQVLSGTLPQGVDFDEIDELWDWEIQAPRPTNPVTLWLLEEYGYDINESSNWPVFDREWVTPEEMVMEYTGAIADSLNKFYVEHQHDWLGYAVGQIVAQAGFHGLSVIVNPHELKVSWDMAARHAEILFRNSYFIPPDVPKAILEDWWEATRMIAENRGYAMQAWELERAAQSHGFQLDRHPGDGTDERVAEVLPDVDKVNKDLMEAGYPPLWGPGLELPIPS